MLFAIKGTHVYSRPATKAQKGSLGSYLNSKRGWGNTRLDLLRFGSERIEVCIKFLNNKPLIY